jgi:alpha-tubulin suppressor-like RCC1 family protein
MTSLVYPAINSDIKYANVLLIDREVPDFQSVYDSVNDETLPIVYSNSSSKVELLTLLNTHFRNISRIGFFFAFSGMTKMFLDSQPFFSNSEEMKYSENVEFIINIINKFGVKNIDFLACNTLNLPNWISYYNLLTKETNVVVGASNDRTGNIKYGGDWVMETTCENIEFIYFTKTIEYYQYLLDLGDTSIIIDMSNKIYGTGYNMDGQLGLGNNNDQTSLQQMIGLPITGKKPVAISFGDSFTVVLFDDGAIYGTGYNNYGQLGLETTGGSRNTLQPMIGLPIAGKKAVAISCGDSFTVVLFDDGTIYGTGNNGYGTLGLGPTNTGDQNSLQPMIGLPITGKKAVAISCGNSFTVVLFDDGTIYGTGGNWSGQLGLGPTNTGDQNSLQPMIGLPSGKTAVAISCGYSHTAVLFADGTIYVTGWNVYGQLGLGPTNTGDQNSLQPMVGLPSGTKAVAISCGSFHTAVLFADGTIYGTGYNWAGRLGLGPTNTGNQNTLQPMIGLPITGKKAVAISCGNSFTVVLFDDGTIYGTGANYSGQLGLGNTTYSIHSLTQMLKLSSTGSLIPMTNVNKLWSSKIEVIPISNVFALSQLKTGGFTVAELKNDFSIAQLITAEFSLAQLKTGGFTSTELKYSFTATQLKDAGFTLAQLKTAEFTAAELKTLGFTLAEFKTAGFTTTELKYSFTLAELKTSGFTLAQLKTAFTVAELKTSGFTLAELITAGFTATELKTSFTLAELKTSGFTLAELKTAFTVAELKTSGFTLAELITAGFTATQLKTAFTLAQLKDAGFTLEQFKTDGFTATELKTAFTLAELKTGGFTSSELKTAGFTETDLITAGFTLEDFKQATVRIWFRDTFGDGWNNGSISFNETNTNVNVVTLTGPASGTRKWFYIDAIFNNNTNYTITKVDGYYSNEISYAVTTTSTTIYLGTETSITASDVNCILAERSNGVDVFVISATELIPPGSTATQLKDAGFTASQLKTNGFTLAELITAFTPAELKTSFTLAEFKTAGFTATQLKTAFTLAELKNEFMVIELKTAFTLAELKTAFTLAQIKTGGFTVTELKNEFMVIELKTAFTLAELKTAFTLAQLKTGGFTATELKTAFTTNELFNSGFTSKILFENNIDISVMTATNQSQLLELCDNSNVKKIFLTQNMNLNENNTLISTSNKTFVNNSNKAIKIQIGL